MNGEKIRVAARVMLVGKTNTGNLLSAFSAFLRSALLVLSFAVSVRWKYFFVSVAGKLIFVLCCVALASGFLLVQCVRTVKDRWYFSLYSGMQLSVTELMTAFGLRDILLSVRMGAVSGFHTLSRLLTFLGLPCAASAASLLILKDGASRSILAVTAAGNAALLLCGALFAAAMLDCVSLARSLSCEDMSGFTSRLRVIEDSAFSLFRFSLFLSVWNRSYRRLSKLLFANILLGRTRKV